MNNTAKLDFLVPIAITSLVFPVYYYIYRVTRYSDELTFPKRITRLIVTNFHFIVFFGYFMQILIFLFFHFPNIIINDARNYLSLWLIVVFIWSTDYGLSTTISVILLSVLSFQHCFAVFFPKIGRKMCIESWKSAILTSLTFIFEYFFLTILQWMDSEDGILNRVGTWLKTSHVILIVLVAILHFYVILKKEKLRSNNPIAIAHLEHLFFFQICIFFTVITSFLVSFTVNRDFHRMLTIQMYLWFGPVLEVMFIAWKVSESNWFLAAQRSILRRCRRRVLPMNMNPVI